MGQLTPTDLYATVTFLGVNRDEADLTTSKAEQVNIDYTGFIGDTHAGLTRASCVRVAKQYPKGTTIRNVRQISALSIEELTELEASLGLEYLNPEWVGANIVFSGINKFSQIPPSSRLIAENGTAIVVDMENAPCKFPGNIIDKHHPGKGAAFAKSAIGKRGVTMWVEREGSLKLGDLLRLHIPPVCHWQVP